MLQDFQELPSVRTYQRPSRFLENDYPISWGQRTTPKSWGRPTALRVPEVSSGALKLSVRTTGLEASGYVTRVLWNSSRVSGFWTRGGSRVRVWTRRRTHGLCDGGLETGPLESVSEEVKWESLLSWTRRLENHGWLYPAGGGIIQTQMNQQKPGSPWVVPVYPPEAAEEGSHARCQGPSPPAAEGLPASWPR